MIAWRGVRRGHTYVHADKLPTQLIAHERLQRRAGMLADALPVRQRWITALADECKLDSNTILNSAHKAKTRWKHASAHKVINVLQGFIAGDVPLATTAIIALP